MTLVQKFLTDHKLLSSFIDMDELVKTFTEDMVSGLQGKEGALRMIPTYIEAENDFLKDTPVLAIDAGGTNFRAACVTISRSGKTIIEDLVNYSMPGLDREIGSKEFFSTIAGYVRPLAGKIQRIGFCFSYPTQILPDRDGCLIEFCKEVKAPQVEGMMIGRNLLESLGTPDKKIVLLNDTVATLLAGKSSSGRRSYDSYIGFILGTGTNTCYIEQNINILKNSDLKRDGSQIINIESGDWGRPPRGELDLLFDNTTANPRSYVFEKMFSGGYFGGLTLFILKTAAKDGFFAPETARVLSEIEELPAWEASSFAEGSNGKKNILYDNIVDKRDIEFCKEIIDSLIDRAAKLVAAGMAAVILKCDKGRSAEKPVLITVDGTTFYELYHFRDRFMKYFENYLTGEQTRFFEFAGVPHSSLVGAALAGLID